MKILPRFSGEFLASLQPDSPEEMFVCSVNTIDSAYRRSTIIEACTEAWFEDFIERRSQPLYIIDDQLSHGPQPSDEVISAKWKNRLLGHGEIGEIVVNAIGELKTSSDLLLGKAIDYCMPYKRELNPDSGYIAGNRVDYAPWTDSDPALFLQIGNEAPSRRGIYVPILSLCNISIH